MNEPAEAKRAAASMRAIELLVGLLILVFGIVVVADSWRLGARWADDGPEAGYFPFYVGLAIVIASLIVLARAVRTPALSLKAFVEHGQLKMVLSLLIPSILYVVLIHVLGIYLASTLFIGFFMIWLGKYSIAKTLPVALGVSIAFFLLFEIWFKVPLPKGPLETALGFG